MGRGDLHYCCRCSAGSAEQTLVVEGLMEEAEEELLIVFDPLPEKATNVARCLQRRLPAYFQCKIG